MHTCGVRNVLLFAVSVAIFLTASPVSAVGKTVAERWQNQLATTTTMLKAASYAEALPVLRKLIDDMLSRLGPSDETTYVLVVPLIQIALAEEGLGEHEAALWHWDMAQTLYPKAAETDLSMFGDPGMTLKLNTLRDPNPSQCIHPQPHKTQARVLKPVSPKYPEGARQFRERGLVIIDMRIGADGSVAEPRVVKPLSALLTYAALEATRKWRFAPATIDGKPVASNLCVTVNYELER
jgi:TonB family protein